MRKLIFISLIQFWVIILFGGIILWNQYEHEKQIEILAKSQTFGFYTNFGNDKKALEEWNKLELGKGLDKLISWAK